MKVSLNLILIVMTFCVSQTFAREEVLTIVTDTWPPYVMFENQQVAGTDVDIARAVFNRMNVPVRIEVLPWKRCVELVRQAKADGILGISLTEDRRTFLHYPNAPISTGITVLFTRRESDISYTSLNHLADKRAGAILGYSYCDELDSSVMLQQAERVSSLEQNFNKLLIGRLDLLVEVDSVGLHTAKQMGISEQISILHKARFCEGGNYLAFARKPGLDAMAERFNLALQDFKLTDEYRQILQNYGTLAASEL